MIGASTAIGAAGSVYPPVTHKSPHLSDGASHSRQMQADSDKSGALASAERVVSQALGSAGFVDLSVSFNDSFLRGLQYSPVETGMEDLKPGVLQDLVSWAATRIAMSAADAMEAQAWVSPEVAVKLLT